LQHENKALAGGTVPAIGEVVEYVEEIGKDGRLKAVNVRPVVQLRARLGM
jgi:hypothetical protein